MIGWEHGEAVAEALNAMADTLEAKAYVLNRDAWIKDTWNEAGFDAFIWSAAECRVRAQAALEGPRPPCEHRNEEDVSRFDILEWICIDCGRTRRAS